MNWPAIPATGYLDLHCHLLPGLDDGCATVDESLDCIRQLIAAGFRGSVCTPHITRDAYPENKPERIAEAVAQLQTAVDGAGLNYALWPGGEVRIARSTVAWLESVGVPTLGSSRWVLIDHWGPFWPESGDELIDWLTGHGYQVVLAHPERMELMLGSLDDLLTRLERQGVVLQGNLNSLAGREGPRAASLADQLLGQQRYHLLASDTHHPLGLPSRMSVVAGTQAPLDQKASQWLLADRPRQLLKATRSEG